MASLAARDAEVAAILELAGRHVGRALAGIATVIDPERIVISGEGVRLGEHYLGAIRDELAAREQKEEPTEIVIEPWGDEAWARGAATLVLRELFHPAHLRDDALPNAATVERVGPTQKSARAGRRRSSMKSRSAQRLLALIAAAPLVLSACLGTSASTAPSVAPSVAPPASQAASLAPSPSPEISGTVTFWNGYAADGEEIKTLTDVVLPAFKKLYPNVTVEHQEIPYDDLRQKLVTGLAGGTLPDVLRADIIWVPEFADQGVLLALDEEMPDFADLTATMFDGPVSTNKWGDHYYGLPLDTNTRVLFYNKGIFDDAGVAAAPATIDDLEAAMAKVKASAPTTSGTPRAAPVRGASCPGSGASVAGSRTTT